jgi:hypothetical protein
MRKIRRMVAVALAVATFGTIATTAVADAARPGPGDKQCIPGQNGNPHPGFKAGACSNP